MSAFLYHDRRILPKRGESGYFVLRIFHVFLRQTDETADIPYHICDHGPNLSCPPMSSERKETRLAKNINIFVPEYGFTTYV